MISGLLDRLVPPYVAHDYARAMQRKDGASIEIIDIPCAGHFDLVTPGTRAWKEVKIPYIGSISATPGSFMSWQGQFQMRRSRDF